MLVNVTHILQHICRLQTDRAIIAGVSGGPDSMCLLDLLLRCGYPVTIVHLNHQLRPGAEAEELRLKNFAARVGVRFISKRMDVRAYARSKGMSVEDAAREVRYQFMFEVAAEARAQAVAVGHNADDQVETVLMHLLRGSGLAGLRGMEPCLLPNRWSADVPLVRPLLSVRRSEILEYLDLRGLPYETDESNTDTNYFRNRVRHELIPYLASYNPEISASILRMAEILRGEYAVVEAEVEEASRKCRYRAGNGYVAMSLELWMMQPPAVQRSLLRKAADSLQPGLKDIGFAWVERAMGFLSSGRPGSRELGNGLYAVLDPEDLFLTTAPEQLPVDAWPQLPPGVKAELDVPGECRLANGWMLTASLVGENKLPLTVQGGRDETQAWLDLDTLSRPIIVRPRLPGDRLLVLGMGGRSAKLSDLMINARIPHRARQNWPVVESGGEVVWVPGIRMSDRHRITGETKRCAVLKVSKA